jgi:hypothetical protein
MFYKIKKQNSKTFNLSEKTNLTELTNLSEKRNFQFKESSIWKTIKDYTM